MAVVPAVLAIVTALTGEEIPIDPAALIGVAGVLMAYLFGQSWVDKEAVKGQAQVIGNESLIQAQTYIKYLESQLATVGLNDNVVPIHGEEL